MTVIDTILPGAVMTTTNPKTALSVVTAAVQEFYGLDTQADILSSERDELFRLTARDGSRYILRFSNPGEPEATTQLQTNALRWLATADTALPVPRIVSGLNGEPVLRRTIGEAPLRTIRLMTYLEGRPMADCVNASAQRRALGRMLARMDLALAGFDDPGADHVLAWDIRRTASLRPFLPKDVIAGSSWDAVRQGLDDFSARVAPVQDRLRTQVVHGDMNPHNVLLRPEDPGVITGIIDFGDMVKTPLVYDLAIGAAYQLTGPEPLQGAVDVIRAFHEILPLDELEVDLLFDLIIARLCTAVIITEWRAARYPENSAYILKNTTVSWNGLRHLAQTGRAAATALFRQACNLE